MTQEITIASAKVTGLLFTRMQVTERLGELFTYDVEFESQQIAIDLSGLLKSPMVIKLETQDGYKRYFHGMVCEAEQLSVDKVQDLVYAKYRARLVPRPWLLMGMVDCRIFKNQSVTQIVKTVLSEAGYTDVTLNLSGTYPAREYCVQYREDGWNFIQRLLQQEGIYFYFTHAANKHTMVLADGVGSHAQARDFTNVPYQPSGPGVLRTQSAISAWQLQRGVDGATIQLTDYNPLKPKASLLVNAESAGHQADGITVFDYPGTHAEASPGKHYAQVRAEALSAERSRYFGRTGACSITIGGLFTLKDHPRKPLNCEYLVTGTAMKLSGPGYASSGGEEAAEAFECTFEALESSLPYRSPQTARKPTVPGLQTAIVTGSETDEDIAVDQYGRVQVNFHWNMPGKKNADCSCPVRVASMWAGKNWGAVSYPRVGQEVVVSFIEGDPDRPLIIGSVYNAANMAAYALPDSKTQSGIRSRSLLGGAEEYNELRFEDKKGEEDVVIRAQKDMHEEVEEKKDVRIGNAQTTTLGFDFQFGDDVPVTPDNAAVLAKSAELKEAIMYFNEWRESLTAKGVSKKDRLLGGLKKAPGAFNLAMGGVEVAGEAGADVPEVVVGSHVTNITGDGGQAINIFSTLGQSLFIAGVGGQNTFLSTGNQETLLLAGDQATKIKRGTQELEVGKEQNVEIGGDQKVKVAGSGTAGYGTTYALTAGEKISLTCGKASITMESSGAITISGSTISLSATDSVTVSGDSSVSVTGGKISAKADSDATIRGNKVTIAGSGKVAVNGGMVSVNSVGIASVRGSLVKLG